MAVVFFSLCAMALLRVSPETVQSLNSDEVRPYAVWLIFWVGSALMLAQGVSYFVGRDNPTFRGFLKSLALMLPVTAWLFFKFS